MDHYIDDLRFIIDVDRSAGKDMAWTRKKLTVFNSYRLSNFGSAKTQT